MLFCQANCFNFQSNQDSFFVRLLAWHIKFEKCKHLKKKISEELMPIAWHPERWWNFCMSEDEKKEIEPNFTEWLNKCASVVSNIEVLKHFGTENCS